MTETTIELRGFEELENKLERLGDLQRLRPPLMAGALHVKGKIAQYPPASMANSDAQPRWYERGYGPRWRRKDGSVGGRRTSETLGRKWTVANKDRGLTKIIGNNVSYGPYVQSAEKQARFHKRRGWKTDEQVINEEGERVAGFIKQEVDKILSG